jgi:3-oxoacyl-[acyl-carrier-protein] synthase III
MEKATIGIRAVGSFVPQQTRTIVSPEGREVTVRVASQEETTYTIGAYSVDDMLARAGLDKKEMENQYFFVNGETYGDYLFQMHGRQIADKAGIDRIISFNLYQGSNSSLMLMRMLLNHLRVDNDATYAMLAAPETWEHHSVGRLLGDAVLGDVSTVLLLEKGYERNKILSIATKTIHKYHDIVYNEVGGWVVPIGEEPCAGGRFVYKVQNVKHYEEVKTKTLDILEPVMQQALDKAGVKWDEIGKFVIHSATPTLHERFLERFNLTEEQVIDSGLEYGYLCSAGLLMSLQTLVHHTELAAGTKVLTAAFGIDGNWAAAVIEV